MVVHGYSPNTWEAEKGETGVPGQFAIHTELQASQNYTEKLFLKNEKKELRSSTNLKTIKNITNFSLLIGFLMYSRH